MNDPGDAGQHDDAEHKASDRPMRRAISRLSGGRRDTSSEMNTTLSMPSTISIALKAMKLAQTCGSVSQSIRWHESGRSLRAGMLRGKGGVAGQ